VKKKTLGIIISAFLGGITLMGVDTPRALALGDSCNAFENWYYCEANVYTPSMLQYGSPTVYNGGAFLNECSYADQCTNMDAEKAPTGYCGRFVVYGCSGQRSCNCPGGGIDPPLGGLVPLKPIIRY